MNTLLKLTLVTILIGVSNFVFGQKNNAEIVYQQRIKKERINGVYIPADLSECFIELNKKVSREAKVDFKTLEETTAAKKSYFGLGRWIWHNWSFYEGSRLTVYLNKVGVNHPEDMAQLIIITYHRYLNKKDLDVKNLAESLRAKRDKEREKRK